MNKKVLDNWERCDINDLQLGRICNLGKIHSQNFKAFIIQVGTNVYKF